MNRQTRELQESLFVLSKKALISQCNYTRNVCLGHFPPTNTAVGKYSWSVYVNGRNPSAVNEHFTAFGNLSTVIEDRIILSWCIILVLFVNWNSSNVFDKMGCTSSHSVQNSMIACPFVEIEKTEIPLTAEQIRMVQETWEIIEPHKKEIGVNVYIR